MTDYLNPDKLYPDDISRRIDTPPGFDSTGHIIICGGAGEQVKSIVKALRGLADALATLTE